MENTDAELAAQPIGYWSGAAHRAIIAYIRGQLAPSASPSRSTGCCVICARTTCRQTAEA